MINPGAPLFLTDDGEDCSMTLENDSWPEKSQKRPKGLQLAKGARKGCFSENNGAQIPVHLI